MRHLRFLHYVDTVARLGSIRKAAERLNVASSALNRRLLDIEGELGVSLFERGSQGVRLTAAGEMFISYVRRTSKDLARVRSDIQELSGLRHGIVRVAAIEAVAHSFLSEELVSFREDYPHITYTVSVASADQVVASVIAGESDIGVTFNQAPNHHFRTVSKVHQRLCALMARDHPLAGRKNLRLADCIPYPLAIPVQTLGGRRLLDEAMVESGLLLNPVLEADNFEIMKQFVSTTGSIALEIEIGAAADVAAGRLAMVPLIGRHLGGSLVLGVRLNRGLPGSAALFCERLARRFDEMAPTVAGLIPTQPLQCDAEAASR
jgi:DNA-binding transcriptional LysR family regulator